VVLFPGHWCKRCNMLTCVTLMWWSTGRCGGGCCCVCECVLAVVLQGTTGGRLAECLGLDPSRYGGAGRQWQQQCGGLPQGRSHAGEVGLLTGSSSSRRGSWRAGGGDAEWGSTPSSLRHQ